MDLGAEVKISFYAARKTSQPNHKPNFDLLALSN
jgi:hypothetical protein